MKVLVVEGYKFNADWLKGRSKEFALAHLTKQPKEVVEKAWNMANGVKAVRKSKPKAAKK